MNSLDLQLRKSLHSTKELHIQVVSDLTDAKENLVCVKEQNAEIHAEKKAIAEVLMEEGYLSSVSVEGEGVKSQIVVVLKYAGTKAVIEGIERVSKSSCRVHCGSREIPRVRNGLGIVVLSTPKGIMSGRKAAKENVGGEILCRVW